MLNQQRNFIAPLTQRWQVKLDDVEAIVQVSAELTNWRAKDVAPASRFGAALEGADFNHDGYPDLAVGAPDDGAGSVSVYYSIPKTSPSVSAGFPKRVQVGAVIVPGLATFHDAQFAARYRCSWLSNGVEHPIDPCTPSNVSDVQLEAIDVPGVHFIRLRVESLDDGRYSEAVTRVDVVP